MTPKPKKSFKVSFQRSYPVIFKKRPDVNFYICTMLRICRIYWPHLVIGWKSYTVIALVSIVFGSMISGAFVSSGIKVGPGRLRSLIITKAEEKMEKLPPIHPGEVLLEDFMKPLGLSQYRVAKDIGVSPIRISQIVHGKRAITADTAMRLARYFGTSAEVWVRMQARYDLEVARDEYGEQIEQEVRALNIV